MTNPFIRDSLAGRAIYYLSGRKLFQNPEEYLEYVLSEKYTPSQSSAYHNSESDLPESTRNAEQIIVSWDGEKDPENPYNWCLLWKIIFLAEIGFLTTSVYIGASIYMPGITKVEEEMEVGRVVATLPMSMFIFGYAVGPMIFSPLSEHPAIGRNYIYISTLFVFFLLQIPTALVKDIGSFIVLRFLGGIFSSPALGTGPASVGDVLSIGKVPIGLGVWSIFAVCGPMLGPVIGGILYQQLNWRWTLWILVITSGISLTLITLFLPETSQEALLYQKARRLRRITGNPNLVSNGEIEMAKVTVRQTIIQTFWRPFEIITRDRSVLFIDLYIGLMYSLLFCYVESIPIAMGKVHGFNSIEVGLSYFSVLVGVLLGSFIYLYVVYRIFTVPFERGKQVTPEVFMPTAITCTIVQAIGIFLYGWTSTKEVHWMIPMIGNAMYGGGAYAVFQVLFNYLSMSFPRYMASVFAGNNLFRAGMGAAFPLFVTVMFHNLGSEKFPIGWGTSILGFAVLLFLLVPIVLLKYGNRLRAASKYAE